MAIRGSPAKGVVGLNRARVRIPPSAPRRSKVRFAPTSFYACGKKDVIRPLPCSSFPTATRCAGLAVGGPPCGRHFPPLRNIDFNRPFQTCGKQVAHRRFFFSQCEASAEAGYLFCQLNARRRGRHTVRDDGFFFKANVIPHTFCRFSYPTRPLRCARGW